MLNWIKEADGSFIDSNECYLLHKRKDRHYDVVPADGPKLNKSRLSLTAAKALAEQHAAGPELPTVAEMVEDSPTFPMPTELPPADYFLRAIPAPVAEQRTKKPKVATVTVERPDGEKADLGLTKAKKPRHPKAKKAAPAPEPTPPEPALTPTQVQAIVDELVWRHGGNVSEWLDYPKLLADAKLHPEQVTDLVLDKAREAKRERESRERPEGPREFRLGQLFVGCCVDAGGRKAEILAANDGEVKVRAYDADGKSVVQHWSPGTMVTVVEKIDLKPKATEPTVEAPAPKPKKTPPTEPVAVPAPKSPKPSKDAGEPSNKEVVYRAWHANKDRSSEQAPTYFKLVKEAVKLTTIRGWISAWLKGQNLPACATK
jgi:hypothetical protein